VKATPSFRSQVRAAMCFAVIPVLFVALSAQPVFAATLTETLPFTCLPAFGNYSVVNTAKIQVPGNSGTRATVYGYATAESYGSSDCTGSYSTTNLACFTYVNAELLSNGAIQTFQTSSTNGGIHQVAVQYNSNAPPHGYGVSVSTYEITVWGNSCDASATGRSLNDTTLVVP
jgi:hypothetical protein